MEDKKFLRKGIQHIFDPRKDGSYAMERKDFIALVDFLDDKSKDGKLDLGQFDISEKVDGFSLKFGLDSDGKFFLASSRSGNQYWDESKPPFETFNKSKLASKGVEHSEDNLKISKGYDNLLKTLQDDQNLINILLDNDLGNGIVIVTEALYIPNATELENGLVKFVTTAYDKSKLGSLCTFVLINVLDSDEATYSESDKSKIFNALEKSSDSVIKFSTSKLDVKDVKFDLSQFKTELNKKVDELKTKFGEDFLSKVFDKKKDSQVTKKEISGEILEFQRKFASRIWKLLGVSSKFGASQSDLEGVVIKIADDTMLKIVSDGYLKSKFGLDRNLDESFEFKRFLKS